MDRRSAASLKNSWAALLVISAPPAIAIAEAKTLRVCPDPNNIPFCQLDREGFENKLAELVAHKLGINLSYTWLAQRRGVGAHAEGPIVRRRGAIAAPATSSSRAPTANSISFPLRISVCGSSRSACISSATMAAIRLRCSSEQAHICAELRSESRCVT